MTKKKTDEGELFSLKKFNKGNIWPFAEGSYMIAYKPYVDHLEEDIFIPGDIFRHDAWVLLPVKLIDKLDKVISALKKKV